VLPDGPRVEAGDLGGLLDAAVLAAEEGAVGGEHLPGVERALGYAPGQLVDPAEPRAAAIPLVLPLQQNPADALLELADVARPRVPFPEVGPDLLEHSACKFRHVGIQEPPQDVPDGHLELVRILSDPLAQRGHLDDIGAEAVVEVVSEQAPCAEVVEPPVGGRNDPAAELTALVAPDRRERPLLEHAQELDLHRDADLPDLVEEDRPVRRASREDSLVPLDGARKGPRELSAGDWKELIYLAHTAKSEGFRRYAEHYLATSGQLYWSDTHQLDVYVDNYHDELDCRLGGVRGSEVITEVYVPRAELAGLLAEAADDFRRHGVNVIYGTVRLIERDDETFLPWARDRHACVVFNLHTDHTPRGVEHTASAFRRLYDMAIRRGGSYFLTYGRHATRAQVEACHPGMRAFLRRKLELDPRGVFQSDWYRHHVSLLSGGAAP